MFSLFQIYNLFYRKKKNLNFLVWTLKLKRNKKYDNQMKESSVLPKMPQSTQTVENSQSCFNVSYTCYKSLICVKVVFFEPQLFSWLVRALKGNEVSDYCTRTDYGHPVKE